MNIAESIAGIAMLVLIGWAWSALQDYHGQRPTEWHEKYIKKLRDKEEFGRTTSSGDPKHIRWIY